MPDLPTPRSLIKTSRTLISSVEARSAGFFSPGQPVRPMGPRDEAGRRLDFPQGYNVLIAPKEGDFGGVGFAELRALAEAHDITRLLVETRKDQLEAIAWKIRPITEDDGVDPSKEQLSRAKDIEKFLSKPDANFSFGTWLRQLAEDLLVLDAPCCYVNRQNTDTRFEVVAGDLIKLLITQQGRRPELPDPAYSQVIKGMPAWFYTTDEMIYLPRNPRPHRIYGMSPVQQIILTVNTALRKQVHQLQYFTEGNIPDALIQVPKDWTPSEILNYEEAFNSIVAGNTAERRKARFVPGEASIIQTKEVILKNDFDEWLARIACFAFSIPPNAFVRQMNRATAVTAKQAAEEEGLAPLMKWVTQFVNMCIQEHLGQYDMEFAFADREDPDPAIQAKVWDMRVRNGTNTINEVRDEMGLEDIEGGDDAMIYLGNTPTLVSKVGEMADQQQQNDQEMHDQRIDMMQNPPQQAPGGGPPKPGGGPPKPGGGKPPGGKPQAKPGKPSGAKPAPKNKPEPAAARPQQKGAGAAGRRFRY